MANKTKLDLDITPVNNIMIDSPGLDPNRNHQVGQAFTDGEIIQIKRHIQSVRISDCVNDEEATGLFKLMRLIEDWQETSP